MQAFKDEMSKEFGPKSPVYVEYFPYIFQYNFFSMYLCYFEKTGE